LVEDWSGRQTDNTTSWGYASPLASGSSINNAGFFSGLVDPSVNDVAATVLEGAEIGALGLPIPTVLCGTDGGVSVIHANGSVYNDTYQVSSAIEAGKVGFNSTGGYWYTSRETVGKYYYFINRPQLIYASTSSATGAEMYRSKGSVSGTPLLTMLGGAVEWFNSAAQTADTFALGQTGGLSLIKYNTGNPEEGAVCDITSDYNTGYMVGDIRFAGLANSRTVDRSVKGNDLAETGTIDSAAVATGAELYAYSGFTASDYLSQANNADFDFTDGKFSAMGWVKVVAGADYQQIISRRSDDTNAGWMLTLDSSEQVYFKNYSPSITSGVSSPLSAGWHFVCGVSDNSRVYIYVDGKLANSATGVAGDRTNSAAKVRVGIHADDASYPQLGSLSLLRISATAPTPQQIKEIYEAEKVLFRSGAKCLLQSTHSTYNNTVWDLSHDKSTGLLAVAQADDTTANNVGVNFFRGLEMVNTFAGSDHGWTHASAVRVATAGGVMAADRGTTVTTGGVLVDLPSIDVRASLLEGESKIPDDGKFHFEGAISDGGSATPTVIGQIPLAEGDTCYITARVFCKKYVDDSDAIRSSYVIEQRFKRQTGGDVSADHGAALSVLRHEGTSTMDAVLSADTSSQTIKLTVTGVANKRSIWSADLDVQRISEKQYER